MRNRFPNRAMTLRAFTQPPRFIGPPVPAFAFGPPRKIGPPVPTPGFPPPGIKGLGAFTNPPVRIGPFVPNPGPGGYPDGTLLKSDAGDAVNVMMGGVRRWIPDPATFTCMGFNWASVQTIPDATWQTIPAGPNLPALPAGTCQATPVPLPPITSTPGGIPIPPNGPLPPGNGYQQVEAPGNPFPYVYIGPGAGLPPGVSSGYPDGTLLKSAAGDSVAVIVGGLRRWIPNTATFTAMGFNWNNVQTIPDATWQNIPTGPAMPDLSGTLAYPSTTALNIPMPNGTVLNPSGLPSSFASSSDFGTQISSFFSQYGTYIALGVGGFFLFKALSGPGGRR